MEPWGGGQRVRHAGCHVLEHRGQRGGIYLAGGGRLAGTLLPEIDELVLKVYPVVAGAGVRLFETGFAPTAFTLVGARPFDSGAVVLTYTRTRS